MKVTQGLESPAEHFKALDSFLMDEQMLLLKAVLKKDLEENLCFVHLCIHLKNVYKECSLITQ